ncbi:MAG: hypothetical protein RR646_04235 [Erysipelotrichaceae bacterium]
MANYNEPIIMENDFDLMKRINKHGYVDLDYIKKYCYLDIKESTMLARLNQLEKYKYIIKKRTFIPADSTASYRTGYVVIALDLIGLSFMREFGFDCDDNTPRIKSTAPYRMYHQVQIAFSCDSLEDHFNSSVDTNFKLIKILNEKEAYNPDVYMQPDAVLIFQNKSSKMYFAIFVEVERSYSTIERINKKLENYDAAFKSKYYDKLVELPIVHNRILFISQNESQTDLLIDKILKNKLKEELFVLIGKYYDVVNDPLSDAYIFANDNNRYKLLSKLEHSHKS